MPYVPAPDDSCPSFALDRRDGREQVVVPARRFRGQVESLALGLLFWPLAAFFKLVGGAIIGGWRGAAIIGGGALLVVLLFALLQVAWWLAGREWIAVVDKNLHVRHTILGVTVATRSYRGADIRFLAPASHMPSSTWSAPSLPFLGRRTRGALKFRFGGRTVFFAHDLLPADAGRVATWLAPRLPPGAVETVL